MTPKSLLRAPAAESPASAFPTGAFQRTITDPEASAATRRLLLCSGKVAFDLLAHRAKHPAPAVAVVRVEQLYPFPADEIAALLSVLPAVAEARWVQEEPRNMGAWSFVQPRLAELLGDRPLRYVGRPGNPSPATGSARLHQLEQEHLVEEAFAW
jgi:2-oxoglutarate dehydrogenase E1 component